MASFVESPAFKTAKNFLFGVGASVVIIGAWAKLTHQPWANMALTVGLGTEAFIFALSGFVPPEKDYYWERIIPGLDLAGDRIEGIDLFSGVGKPATKQTTSATASLDKMLEEAKLDKSTINKLGDSFAKLNESVNSLSTIASASISTEQFAEQTRLATKRVTDEAELASKQIAEQAKEVNQMLAEQTKQVTQVMDTLSQNIDNLNKVYGNMLSAMKA
ncbi:MAG: gliding motility protein GldL [Chitinophagales bacterium]|nr:gliding motility protein GldL [Chitinophagales bacterium]